MVRPRADDRPSPALVERLRAALRERGSSDRAARRLASHLLPERAADVERFRAHLGEAAVAVRLWRRGCELDFEVPVRSGRTADFLVVRGSLRFAVHVKRWGVSTSGEATLRVPLSLRALESIPRPYLVAVQWPRERRALREFVREAAAFLLRGRIGDERVVRDAQGRASGRVRILAPWPGERVVLAVGLDAARDDALDEEVPRLQRLLRRAYAQFMPGVPNVIVLLGGGPRSEYLVDTAILGSHVERWDHLPARGQRVAHGRGDDGFWTAGRYAQSTAIGWCPWSDARGAGAMRLWCRDGDCPIGLREALR